MVKSNYATAMVHYEMENYGKSLDDAKEALKLDPKQIKAWYRAAKATFAVRKFDQCQTFCDGGLAVAPNVISKIYLLIPSDFVTLRSILPCVL